MYIPVNKASKQRIMKKAVKDLPEEALEDLKESKKIIDFIRSKKRPSYQLFTAIFFKNQRRSCLLLEFDMLPQGNGRTGRHPKIKVNGKGLISLEKDIEEKISDNLKDS